MRAKHWLALIVLLPATALAWDQECKLRADRAGGTEAGGVEKVVIRAGAGGLKVVGRSTAVRVEARGVACAAKQSLLDATQIHVRREGNVVYVETTLPQSEDGWSWGDDEYAYLDLGVALPNNVPVEAIDSSGDAGFEDLKELTVQDSSGELRVERISGAAIITDSSGDLRVETAGSVRVQDSSGEIRIENVHAGVEVISDSSGGIVISQVDGDVKVLEDSSGDIRIEDVKGSVEVGEDSSGSIFAGRVGGDFTVRGDSSGSIEHEAITGRVTVPSNKMDVE